MPNADKGHTTQTPSTSACPPNSRAAAKGLRKAPGRRPPPPKGEEVQNQQPRPERAAAGRSPPVVLFSLNERTVVCIVSKQRLNIFRRLLLDVLRRLCLGENGTAEGQAPESRCSFSCLSPPTCVCVCVRVIFRPLFRAPAFYSTSTLRRSESERGGAMKSPVPLFGHLPRNDNFSCFLVFHPA